MRAAAILIDIDAAGVVMHRQHFRPEGVEDGLAGAVAGSVRGIERDDEPFKEVPVIADTATDEVDVALGRAFESGDSAHRSNPDRGLRRDHSRFDFQFERIVELVAVGSEEFDAVVFKRIV
jgi:hypothetical protein